MHATDSLTWYRQFWPWFLILLPATVVVAAVSTMIIANSGADDLVVDDYYKSGLAINQRLIKEEQAAALGINSQLTFEGLEVEVILTAPQLPGRLSLQLSHPMEADRDFTVELPRVGTSHYRAPLPEPVAARWHWILEPAEQAEWRLTGIITNNELARDNPH